MSMRNEDLRLGVQFNFQQGVSGTLFGGPFRKYVPGTRRMVGLKMAEEIQHPSDFDVDTPDFGVPNEEKVQQALVWCMQQFKNGNDVYVGCMGGTGRTGLLIGCMVKTFIDFCEGAGIPCEAIDPVFYTREKYKPHAIETPPQEAFVRGFDTGPVLEGYEQLIGIEVQVQEVEVEVIKEVYITPWEAALRLFGFSR